MVQEVDDSTGPLELLTHVLGDGANGTYLVVIAERLGRASTFTLTAEVVRPIMVAGSIGDRFEVYGPDSSGTVSTIRRELAGGQAAYSIDLVTNRSPTVDAVVADSNGRLLVVGNMNGGANGTAKIGAASFAVPFEYGGSTLRRPALERLRDRVAYGAVDAIYVHSPDRLARRHVSHRAERLAIPHHGFKTRTDRSAGSVPQTNNRAWPRRASQEHDRILTQILNVAGWPSDSPHELSEQRT